MIACVVSCIPLLLGAIQALYRAGYTPGLLDLLTSHAKHFAARIWILDNSGSMAIGDGYRIVETADRRVEGQTVTRWEELKQMVVDQAEVAALLNIFTEFRFLNDPGEAVGCRSFSVGTGTDIQQEIMNARTLMLKAKPTGASNIQAPLKTIVQRIQQLRNRLVLSHRRVSIVIATDGVPTDEDGSENSQIAEDDFISTLRSLEDLPVWVVVRLCTSQKRVVNYWNSLDAQVNLQLEVLDDHLSEAKEIARHNKWLNYALPLHRCREMGCQHRVLDLLDERKLTPLEVREFCVVVLGSKAENLPDPTISWKAFSIELEKELKDYRYQWDPLKKKMKPWIDIRTLNHTYGNKGFLGRLG